MALLQVQSNGNAPSNAKVGDHIVTAGGTYQVVDGSKYQGLEGDALNSQLTADGVGFNPSSGLYSKKISDVSTNSMYVPDTSYIDSWRNANNQKVTADLDSAYYTDRQNAYNTYNNSMTQYAQQMNNVKQNYLDNITKLYDDTYQNNAVMLERAANRGLTSSGLGAAMQVSGLANASKQNAQYRAQRNTDLNNIEANMIGLTNNYNVNLDTLISKLQSDKISALSQNEVAYLNALMEVENKRSDSYNSILATLQQQAYEAAQSQLERDYQAVEKQKDRDLQVSEAALDRALQEKLASFSGSGYGSYGGYSRGSGYSRRYGSGYSSGSSSSGSSGSSSTTMKAAAQYLNSNYSKLSTSQKQAIAQNIVDGNTAGVISSISAVKQAERKASEKNGSSGSSEGGAKKNIRANGSAGGGGIL